MLVLTPSKSGSIPGRCTMAVFLLPVLNVFMRYIITCCDILFTSRFGVENRDCIGDWHEHTTHNCLHRLKSVATKNYEVSWNFLFIYAPHDYGEWLDVHIHSLPPIQDVVTIVVQYFEGMALLVTDKLRIFLPNHTGTHTRARIFMLIKHNGKCAAQKRANARKYKQQNRV